MKSPATRSDPERYPIILIPPALESALESSPVTEPFPPIPALVNAMILLSGLVGVGLTLLMLYLTAEGLAIDPAAWIIPVAAVAIVLWELPRYLQDRQRKLRLRQERERYAKALKTDPSKLVEWRRKRVETILSLKMPLLLSNHAKPGRYDGILIQALQTSLPQLEFIQDRKVGYYTPDIIVLEPQINLYIDIEVDEPWHINSDGERAPSHWQGKDQKRNHYFLDQTWVVIRFAEEQVALQTRSCVKVVAEVIQRFNPSFKIPDLIARAKDLKPVASWNQSEAIDLRRY